MMQDAIELFDEVRLTYHRLVEVLPEVHGDLGVSPPQRAVLEHLHRHGPASVPAVARARNVTRQHIQTIVNDLRVQDLVWPEPNPAHQRSPLFTLTSRGEDTIADIVRRERDYLSPRLVDLDDGDLQAARRTLADLRHRL